MARDKRIKKILSFLLLPTLLSLYSCFPLGNYLELSMKIIDINDRVETIERKVDQKSISKTDEKIAEIQKNVLNLQKNLASLQSEFENIKKGTGTIAIDTTNVDDLNRQLLGLKTEVSNIQSIINSLKSNSDKNTNKLSEIEKSLLSANNQITQLTQRISDLEKNTTSLTNRITTVEGKVQDVQTTTNSSISQLSKRITDLEKVTNTTSNKVANIENQLKEIDSIKKDLDVLSMRVRGIQDNLTTNISQTDIQLLKQIQQQIQEIKSTIQTLSPEELLRLKDGYIYYVVKSGDNLSSIANAYNVKLNDLAQLNNISDVSKISIGQVIKIPVSDPSQYVRVPVKINPSDILTYHGQNKNGTINLGLDIYARGKDIYPILPGKVLSVDNYTVRIDHGNMITAVYSGVNTSLKVGSFVSNSKPLGQCIDVFHFELYIDGEPRDPLRLFTEYKGIFTVTFYSEWDDGKVPSHPTFRIARNGKVPEQFKTIAVDPTVIPIGSLVYIPTLNNTIFIAEDTGSAIKGNRIDVYVSDVRMALNNGISPHPVYVIYPEKNVQ